MDNPLLNLSEKNSMTQHIEHQTFRSDEIPYQEISDPVVLSKNPVVSVHMITYNHELYIAQAIEGVLMQETNFPIELVIGEDCSTDRTHEIVLEYQRKHPDIIKGIFRKKNVGSMPNFIDTFKHCKGKYIAICEGDDYWHHPQKLQEQVDYLEAHPECGLVHSDGVRYIVENCKKIPYHSKKEKLLNNENVVKSMIEWDYYVITCSAVVRKDLIEEIYKTCQFEFSEKFLSGDFQLWLEIAYRSKVKYIDESFVTYNVLPESAIHTKDIEKKIRLLKYWLEIHIHYVNKYGDDDSMGMKKEIVRRVNRGLILLACRACKHDLAKEVLENARKYQAPLDPMGYLYFIGSRNIVASYFVRILVLPMRIVRKTLRVMKLL